MATAADAAPSLRERLGGAGFVAAVFAAYYALFFWPPRAITADDPDRHYHLGLSALMADGGLLRRLPQVEDLGWGAYFPDKEFLFHALTGGASWLGGDAAVLWLVPLLGTAIALWLYWDLSRGLRPWQAALVATGVPLLTAAFAFRLAMLRPHLLAILAFCVALVAIARAKPRLTAAAAAAFALAYHGIYILGFVAGIAWLLRNQPGFRDRHAWAWCLGGLALGVVVNPYFPSNLEHTWLSLRLALGLEDMPLAARQQELAGYTLKKLVLAYGFLPALLAATAAVWAWRRPGPGPERTRLAFLWLVTAAFWLLGVQTPRAMEYAVPCAVLLVGHAAMAFAWRPWLPLAAVLLLAPQGYVDWVHYRANWREVARPTAYDAYARLLKAIPPAQGRTKVFICEWEAGSFVLHARPDLRFVDLLEPAFLWRASRDRYLVRAGLVDGRFADPRRRLREVFGADYVLCASPALVAQMDANPADFTTIPGTRGDTVRLFAVRP